MSDSFVSDSLITIYVDGEAVQADPAAMLLNVIDSAGMGERVPRMCHHKELFPAGNCRVCVVEIDGMPNTVPSCHTPITEGMKISTNSEKVVSARQAVIEFMLINHPLDCLVCDQGGDCELQDMVYQFGVDHSRFNEEKLDKQPEDISPLIAVNANRCIKCMRCVRFLEEISGERELGMLNRGENCKISPFFDETVSSKLSGNTIDVCPVGALLPKSATHKIRPWELERTASVSPYDALGTNVYVNSFDDEVIKVTPRENSSINGCWISDQDRFGFLAMEPRLEQPVSAGKNISWEQAQQNISKMFADANDAVLFMVSPAATLEEMLAIENLAAALPNAQIDYCPSHTMIENDYHPCLGMNLDQLSEIDLIILAGASLDDDLPVLGARLRKVAAKGCQSSCKIVMIDPDNPDKGLVEGAKKPLLLFGKGVAIRQDAGLLRQSLINTFNHSNLKTGDVSGEANSAAASILQELALRENVTQPFKKVVFVGATPYQISAKKRKLIEDADQVLALLSCTDKTVESHSDLIVPILSWPEVSGSYVNMELKKQSFEAAIHASFSSKESARSIQDVCQMIADAAKVSVEDKITMEIFENTLAELCLSELHLSEQRLSEQGENRRTQ